MTHHKDDPLDAFFAAAQADPPQASDDLLQRVMRDASDLQPQVDAWGAAPEPSVWTRFKDMVGGWPSIAGLATATAAGLWIGIDTPMLADSVMSLYFDTGSAAAFDDADLAWASVLEEI
ncbi:hypothetical protein [Algirhabdus cladophorae]|uniref:hypothetical protein n=1 Tax=Algirhabdus cladophorae TaxID=3377108 RepID=UPI003B8471CD